MRLRGDALWLAVAVAIVVALTLARPVRVTTVSTYSSYDTGVNGYRAVYEVMRREGVGVHRLERDIGTLHGFVGTLVLSSSDPERYALRPAGRIDRDDLTRIAAMVRSGARLVVLGDALRLSGEAIALPTASSIPPATVALRTGGGALTEGVQRVSASFTRAFVLDSGSHVSTLLAARGRPVVIALRLGRGSVVAIAAPDVFSNGVLADAQNARLAYDILSGNSPVLFDERLHGHVAGASMWDVLPGSVRDAVWVALAALLLAVFGSLFRSAPPMAVAPPRLRDSSAYIGSMAALLRRARAGSAAIERFAQDAARLARARPGAAARPEIAAEISVLEELRRQTGPSDAALLEAARISAHVRKELA